MSVGRWISDLGPTNPIILRIVANGSRRVRHLWIRAGFLAVLMVALLLGMVGSVSSMRDLAQRGATAFTALSFVEVTLICVLTPLFMAGAIAQESNPRTWEILLTTPLNRVQIVVGNLFGRLFFVLALLVAALPLMLATQFFGGVPPTAVWGSFGISACTAHLVGAVAVSLSIVRSAGKRTVFVALAVVGAEVGWQQRPRRPQPRTRLQHVRRLPLLLALALAAAAAGRRRLCARGHVHDHPNQAQPDNVE